MPEINELTTNKMSYPKCDALSCHPDNHPGEPCCVGHDEKKMAARMNAEWPPLDNPHTCSKKASKKRKQSFQHYEDADRETAWMNKYLQIRKEQAEEAKRWAERIEDMERIYREDGTDEARVRDRFGRGL